MENKKVNFTLVDVAKHAGVSPATASRVLNNTDYPVSSTLRKRVIKAASDLNYTPNFFGKMLKTNVSNAIGVIVPSLQNPFYNQVIIGIESAAAKAGHEIMLLSSHRNIEQERANISVLLRSRVMTLLIISIDNCPDALNNYIACGGNVALLEGDYNLENAITVETDWFSAGHIAAKHLIDLGHQRIALLTTPITKTFRKNILVGIKAAISEAGFTFNDSDIFVAHTENESNVGMYEFEVGSQLTKSILESKKKYTAIIAINDITAFGIIQALTQRGLSVPDNMSVISFDNILFSEMISPPLTTVELPSGNLGRIACNMLLSDIDRPSAHPNNLSLKFPCILQLRQSTGRIK